MPRIFNRVLTFHVTGEIYDTSTKAEDIIKNYSWTFKDEGNGKAYLYCYHKDSRGRITNLTRLPRIHRWKKPDTEFFLSL